MPTPVSTARQCLTDEAARALDDAVTVARRRSHAQTTSLHAVSALISLPSSSLREACARARSSAYSPRLQFRALELSVGVSLDRLPTTKSSAEEPPVSNSLMAAIKRSQANQRRHPDTFHLYQQMNHQQGGQTSSLSCVKVELKHFILSILDDPIVSRVFGEAGFRSCDIKLAILNPPSLSRFTRSRCPPLFLCNLTDPDSTHRNFNFPFAGFSFSGDAGDENCKRIGEVLGRKEKGKNPLLVGVCANEALKSFTERLQQKKTGLLPAEIDGMTSISLEREVSELNKELIDLKIREVGIALEHCSSSGIVVNIGELKALVGGEEVRYVVSEITKLLEIHGEKVRLIGAAGSYETYMKILAQFPSIQKDWDLHLLPITSSTSSSSGGLYTKPSLMGSFVPFGGFFSTPSELKSLSSSPNRSTRCELCNEKYEQEVSILLKGGSTTSVTDQCSSNKPSWLQMAERDASKRQDVPETEDGGTLLNLKLKGVQRKWDDICQRLHPLPFQSGFSQPRVDSNRCSSKDSSSIESRSPDPSTPMDHLQKISPQRHFLSSPGSREAINAKSLPENQVEHSLRIPVTTDLGLGTLYYAGAGKEHGNLHLVDPSNRLICESGSITSENGHNVSCLTSSDPKSRKAVDPKDFKALWRALAEKVGRQGEAVCAVSRTLTISKNGQGKARGSNKRGDVWLSFLGPDKVGQKKTAEALAEVVYGSRDSFISVDLSLEDGISCSNSIFRQQDLNCSDAKFRGKMVVDIVAEELSRRPQSVVLLENVDKADFLFQNSLSQALKNGKFLDSRGREISISNAIFVTTFSNTRFANKDLIFEERHVRYSEERILGAKRWQMRLLISSDVAAADSTGIHGLNISVKQRMRNSKKRKFIDINDSAEAEPAKGFPQQEQKPSRWSLDLNLPLEEEDHVGEDNNHNADTQSESDTISENSEAWLEDFFSLIDEKVVFQAFDFDALANQVLKEIDQGLKKTAGSEFFLEIDEEVVVQILAAAWLCDNKKAVSDWVEQVLVRSLKDRFAAESKVKLEACNGLICGEEQQAPGISLPSRIVLD